MNQKLSELKVTYLAKKGERDDAQTAANNATQTVVRLTAELDVLRREIDSQFSTWLNTAGGD